MGPPKKRKQKQKQDSKAHEQNSFEYRWNSEEGHYYLFNPHSGETVLGENYDNINRNESMWAKPDKHPSREAYSIQLYHESYQSRKWGVRVFVPFEKENEGSRNTAAKIVQSAVRGHQARQDLREYYKHRWYTKSCQFSGYTYFVDSYTVGEDGTPLTQWHKPAMARIGDIKDQIAFDPDDHMADGNKYSFRGFIKGPFLCQTSLGKGNISRAEQKAFIIESDWRNQAVRKNEEIDLDVAPLGTVIAWMDGLKATTLTINHYTQVRAAVAWGEKPNWGKVLEVYDKYSDNILTRLYCWHTFSKTDVPLDGNELGFAPAEVLRRLIEIFSNKHYKSSYMEKIFMLQALHNILSIRPGRAEYLSTKDVTETGDDRQRAIDKFQRNRVTMFNWLLAYIPTDTELTSVKGQNHFEKVRVPTRRAQELVSAIFDVVGDLAWEAEQKELMSESVVEYVYYAMKVCAENGTCAVAGMKIFYSLCYRCEPGQQMILRGDSLGLIKRMRLYHGGDLEVMRYARKLELSLKFNGWRGLVETLMAMEMKGEKIPQKYLKKAEFERKFQDDFMFPLEETEAERVEIEEEEELRAQEMANRLAEEEAFALERALSRASSRASREGGSREGNSSARSNRSDTDGENSPRKTPREVTVDWNDMFANDEGEGGGMQDDDVSLLGDGSVVGVIGTDRDGAPISEFDGPPGLERTRSVHFPDESKEGGILEEINSLQSKVSDLKSELQLDGADGADGADGIDGQKDFADDSSLVSEMTEMHLSPEKGAQAKDIGGDAETVAGDKGQDKGAK